MKIVNLLFQVLLSVILTALLIYFLTAYDSAFEADQVCHAYLSTYENKSGNYGCDHDTETHQWILYNDKNDGEQAAIIKKFRYKFL